MAMFTGNRLDRGCAAKAKVKVETELGQDQGFLRAPQSVLRGPFSLPVECEIHPECADSSLGRGDGCDRTGCGM